MNVLIIGASRGIGFEFVRQYRAAGARITATARDDAALERLREHGARVLKLDVADAASVSGLAWQVDGDRFDVVVINAGVFGPRTSGLQTPSAADFDAVMHTNVLGPMRLLPQVADALAPGARVAIMSSQMGAITGRSNATSWLYRASKAAVNSVMTDAALALAGKATVISFHPGWVRTDMGGAGADIDAATSVAGMRTVLASVKPSDTGRFFNYDGQLLPW
ncbi:MULTISPECIES: SDR family oxidoreductase [Roseateles]|uniref:NAD(P)-dependent dehydrogenase (Short-subunit alcohol dehydrogenase family) n=1 Tax=Pelomonas aquatica TaxID=431058 RepID=A0ABU1ZCE4_9BURK|nr:MULTISPECIES: SDR family oxidoreductase [Roseateles]KQY86010.1 short-chain dehydrogenase [Pelomonas sp. Root1444]MDR7298300.1 NAD(P)-dependent dehydrogenase (short-subunit alcohol dehydrogenase family) [Pelomonas aquatica]